MAAPGSRGALRKVRTTVARPNTSPVSHHFVIGSRMSRNQLHLGTFGHHGPGPAVMPR